MNSTRPGFLSRIFPLSIREQYQQPPEPEILGQPQKTGPFWDWFENLKAQNPGVVPEEPEIEYTLPEGPFRDWLDDKRGITRITPTQGSFLYGGPEINPLYTTSSLSDIGTPNYWQDTNINDLYDVDEEWLR